LEKKSGKVVLCLAQIGQAKPGHVDGFMAALAWPGDLKSAKPSGRGFSVS